MNLRYLNLFNVPRIFFTLLRDIFRLLNSIARSIMNIEKSNCILQVLIDEMNSKKWYMATAIEATDVDTYMI